MCGEAVYPAWMLAAIPLLTFRWNKSAWSSLSHRYAEKKPPSDTFSLSEAVTSPSKKFPSSIVVGHRAQSFLLLSEKCTSHWDLFPATWLYFLETEYLNLHFHIFKFVPAVNSEFWKSSAALGHLQWNLSEKCLQLFPIYQKAAESLRISLVLVI